MKNTALQKIKEIEKYYGVDNENKKFLLKAFNVMREIAIKEFNHFKAAEKIDEEFEERMSK